MNVKLKVIPTIAVLSYKNDEVLLVRHGEKASHLTGTYGLPSGRIEDGEDDKTAAEREFKEETGLEITKEDLIDYPRNTYYANIERKGGEITNFSWHVFIAKKFSGQLKESDETKPEWFALSEIRRLNLLPNVGRAIEDGLRFLRKIE